MSILYTLYMYFFAISMAKYYTHMHIHYTHIHVHVYMYVQCIHVQVHVSCTCVIWNRSTEINIVFVSTGKNDTAYNTGIVVGKQAKSLTIVYICMMGHIHVHVHVHALE